MEISPNVIAFVVACVTIVMGIITGVGYFHTRIATVGQMAAKDNEALAAAESKARHDLANQTQALLTKMELELNRVRETSASRVEMGAMEQRLNAMISEVKQSINSIMEKMGTLAVVEAQTKANSLKLDRLVDNMVLRNKEREN